MRGASYQSEREYFIERMARRGMGFDVARLILRHANTYHRLAERECNGDDWQGGDTAIGIRCGTLVKCPMGLGKHAVRVGDCTECGVTDVAVNGHHYVTKSSVRMTQLERRIRELAARSSAELAVHFQGDPRGYEVRICPDCTCTSSNPSRAIVGVPTRSR